MGQTQVYTGLAAMILAALGMWLMLPRGNQPGRWLGAFLSLASLVLFALLGAQMGTAGVELVFGTLGVVAIVSAVATVTFRSPVYCALWFALSLLATAGVFMMQGAQFLGVATIVVYAGAILVTFLFVVMLAQPEGHAYYDRVSWEGLLAATTGAVIVGLLTMTIVRVFNPPREPELIAAVESFGPESGEPITAEQIHRARLVRTAETGQAVEIDLAEDAPVLSPTDQNRLASHLIAETPSLAGQDLSADDLNLVIGVHRSPLEEPEGDRDEKILANEHVATLGGELFGRHLIAIEVGGTLLLVALVGAIAMVAHDRSSRRLVPQEQVSTQRIGGR